jgi:type VI secretion system protein ImpE
MLAEERLRTGDLNGALEDLQGRVRKAPGDAKLRIFLFQLLTVMGQWDRALTQLKVAGDLDAANLAMVQTYREALRCEVLRAQIFAGKKTPVVFGEPEEWVALLLESLRLGGEGDAQGAESLRAQAFDAAPTTRGTMNGQPFEWIADGDSRLGPMLEAIVNGRYYFVPFHRIRALTLEAPADLRDFVWMPAVVTLTTGADTVALIPTRYPGSEVAEDAALRLAKRTEWTESMGGYVGLGQRTWVTDAGELALLDARTLELGSPDAASSEAASG